MSDVWNVDGPAMPRAGHDTHNDVPQQAGAVPAGGGPAYSPTASRKRSGVTLLVVAGISSIFGCFLAIPATILGILAVVHQEEPLRSAKLTRWGWIAYATGAGLTVLAGAALMVIAGVAATGND